VGGLVRGALGLLPVILLLVAIFLLWRSARVTRWRAQWTVADWVGLAVVLVTAAIILSAFIGHHSYEWLIATGFYKGRIFDLGLRAAGALTIGLGVLPVVAGLAPTEAKSGLLALLAVSVALLLTPQLVRRAVVGLAIAVGIGVIAWNLTGELAFASASNRTSDLFMTNIRRPTTWVDDHTGGAATLYIGQQMKDQNSEWLL